METTLASVDAEALESVGGAGLVLSYRPSRLVALGLFSLVALATLIACGTVAVVLQRGAPWTRLFSLENLHFQTVTAGYLFVFVQGWWQLGLLAFRTLSDSPGLVAGARGLRVHGMWPAPVLLPWDHVEGFDAGPRTLRVRRSPRAARVSPPMRFLQHFFGEPFLVRVPAGTDLAGVMSELGQLRRGDA
ncbi:MAG: hypothetical protein AB7N76_13505 [Planctomycetota bacterium]